MLSTTSFTSTAILKTMLSWDMGLKLESPS